MSEQTDAVSTAEPQPESLEAALGGENELMDQIQGSLGDGEPGSERPVSKMELDALSSGVATGDTMRDLDLLADVEVEVSVEFGRTHMPLRQLLMLRRGSLVELARRPEQQVTILANGTPIALGDIVVVGDQVGVHIVELVEPDDVSPDAPGPHQVAVTDGLDPAVEQAAGEAPT